MRAISLVVLLCTSLGLAQSKLHRKDFRVQGDKGISLHVREIVSENALSQASAISGLGRRIEKNLYRNLFTRRITEFFGQLNVTLRENRFLAR